MDTTFNHLTPSQIAKLRPADVYDDTCPSRGVIQLLADKWTMLVVQSLSSGPMRFGELRRQITGVTQKMLTQTLRALERDGLVRRTVFPTAPPSVEYALTLLGQSITAIIGNMCNWAEHNMKPVLLARKGYDARTEREAEPIPGRTIVRQGRRRET